MAVGPERAIHELEEFVVKLELDDLGAALVAWRDFESQVRQQLAFEERLLLPTLVEADADEGRRLLAEHDDIRAGLARLSSSLRTRLLRAEHVRSFCKTLERHASQHRARCAWIESHTRQDPQPTDRQRPLFGAAPPPS